MTLAMLTMWPHWPPTVAQMTLGQWLLLIFVGVFLLLMVAGLVTWVVQLIRSGRRHRPPNRKKADKAAR